MFTLENDYVPDVLSFRTEACLTFSNEHLQTLDAFRDGHPKLWEQMILCQEAKTVMVVSIGGCRAAQDAAMQLLRSAHVLGVPVLLVPCQE